MHSAGPALVEAGSVLTNLVLLGHHCQQAAAVLPVALIQCRIQQQLATHTALHPSLRPSAMSHSINSLKQMAHDEALRFSTACTPAQTNNRPGVNLTRPKYKVGTHSVPANHISGDNGIQHAPAKPDFICLQQANANDGDIECRLSLFAKIEEPHNAAGGDQVIEGDACIRQRQGCSRDEDREIRAPRLHDHTVHVHHRPWERFQLHGSFQGRLHDAAALLVCIRLDSNQQYLVVCQTSTLRGSLLCTQLMPTVF